MPPTEVYQLTEVPSLPPEVPGAVRGWLNIQFTSFTPEIKGEKPKFVCSRFSFWGDRTTHVLTTAKGTLQSSTMPLKDTIQFTLKSAQDRFLKYCRDMEKLKVDIYGFGNVPKKFNSETVKQKGKWLGTAVVDVSALKPVQDGVYDVLDSSKRRIAKIGWKMVLSWRSFGESRKPQPHPFEPEQPVGSPPIRFNNRVRVLTPAEGSGSTKIVAQRSSLWSPTEWAPSLPILQRIERPYGSQNSKRSVNDNGISREALKRLLAKAKLLRAKIDSELSSSDISQMRSSKAETNTQSRYKTAYSTSSARDCSIDDILIEFLDADTLVGWNSSRSSNIPEQAPAGAPYEQEKQTAGGVLSMRLDGVTLFEPAVLVTLSGALTISWEMPVQDVSCLKGGLSSFAYKNMHKFSGTVETSLLRSKEERRVIEQRRRKSPNYRTTLPILHKEEKFGISFSKATTRKLWTYGVARFRLQVPVTRCFNGKVVEEERKFSSTFPLESVFDCVAGEPFWKIPITASRKRIERDRSGKKTFSVEKKTVGELTLKLTFENEKVNTG